MASSLRTKLRIAYNVLFAPGFFDMLAGRFLWSAGKRISAIDAPKKSEVLPASVEYIDCSGALHIHSTYSDGAGDVETVMIAAKDADIDFVLLCDHNTMKPLQDGWEERYAAESPFLMIGTELTVKDGRFLLALDAPPTYEPDRGVPAQEGIDAIKASGAMSLISLPFDMKHPFEDWGVTGFEGLEVLNFSTVARRHINFLSLVYLLPIGWTGGMTAVMRAMVSRPDAALLRWDSLTAGGERQVVGIGSLDAHAQMKIGAKKYGIPSYVDSFQAARTHVLVPKAVAAANPKGRIGLVNQAIREGRCFFSYDCLGIPTEFRFTATKQMAEPWMMGQRCEITPGEAVRFEASFAPEVAKGSRLLIRLYEAGRVIAEDDSGALSFSTAARPGAYRIEVYRFTHKIGNLHLGVRPWVWSNPIYLSETAIPDSRRNRPQ